MPIDCTKDMAQMSIFANEKKDILSFDSSYTHDIEINGFFIGLNAFEKKIYSTYRERERCSRRERDEGRRKKAVTRCCKALKVIYKRSQTAIISS